MVVDSDEPRAAASGRRRLPNRRLTITEGFEWGGRRWLIGVGFKAGVVREIFLDGLKQGSELEALLDDACVWASRLLQHGETVAELAASVGRESVMPPAPYASVLGRVAMIAWEVERDHGAQLKEVEAATAKRLAAAHPRADPAPKQAPSAPPPAKGEP